jgi:signal transduction histidine kinase
MNDVILRSVAVLRKSNEGERLNWTVNLDEEIAVNADAHDLMELAGIVLENAAGWADSQVKVTCTLKDGLAELVVEDDGKGMSDAQIARLGVRGVRLDESSTGTGLGLSIAFEIVELNRGKVVVDRGELGGLRVTVRLPRSPG